MRLHVRHLLLALLCAVGLSIALSACGGSATSSTTASTPPTTATTPSTTATTAVSSNGRTSAPLSIVEDDAQATGPTTSIPSIAQWRALGGQVLRYNANWSYFVNSSLDRTKPASFDASDPGSSGYNWAVLDAVVTRAHADGLRMYLTLTSPAPLWADQKAPAADARVCGSCNHYEPSASDFAQFVEAIGRRYSGHYTPPGASSPLPRVSFWSIWNEPNYGPNLEPQSTMSTYQGKKVVVDTAAPQYRKLVEAAWNALAATGHTTKTDTILIGETAPRGIADPGLAQMTPPLQFIRDLYCVDSSLKPLTGTVASDLGCPTSGSTSAFLAANPALFDATGWADHPYADGEPPSVAEKSTSTSDDWADFARLGTLHSTLDTLASTYGAHAGMPIYNTEYGYFTKPPGTQYDAIPVAKAALYLNYSEYLTWKDSWLASYDQYLLVDPPSVAGGSMFYTGLEFSSAKPKPEVYDSFRLPLYLPTTAGAPGSALEVWGCARPALSGGSTHVAIQFARSGGSYSTVKTMTLHPSSGGCYFDTTVKFPASGTVRLSYDDGSSGTVTSRTQAITLK